MSPSLRSLVLVSFMLAGAAALAAQDAPAKGPAVPAAPAPGPEHARFKAWAGEWTYTGKSLNAADGTWSESTGSESSSVGAGGFWFLSTNLSKHMGIPFEGRMQLSFDPLKKQYVGSWIDSMGPYLSILVGVWEEDRKTLSLWSDMMEPMQGKTFKVRMTREIKDADHHVFRMYVKTPEDKEIMTMELNYTRKK